MPKPEKSQSHIGQWYTEKPEFSYPGILHHPIPSFATLDLMVDKTAFKNFTDRRNQALTIFGNVQGRNYLLYQCRMGVNYPVFNHPYDTIIYHPMAIIDTQANIHPEKCEFHKVKFAVPGLNAWAGKGHIITLSPDMNKIDVRADLPHHSTPEQKHRIAYRNMTFSLNNYSSIVIPPIFNANIDKGEQTHVQRTDVVLEFAAPVSLNVVFDCVHKFEKFFVFALNYPTWVYDIKLFSLGFFSHNKENLCHGNLKTPFIGLNANSAKHDNVADYRVLFNYAECNPGFSSYIEKWFKLTDNENLFTDFFVSTMEDENPEYKSIVHKFLMLIAACESLFGILAKSNKQIPFAKQMEFILNYLGEDFPLRDKIASIGTCIKTIRRDIVHGKYGGRKHYPYMLPVNNFMRTVQQLHILKILGFSDHFVANKMMNCPFIVESIWKFDSIVIPNMKS